MSATTVFPTPIGTLDAERGELLRRVVDGLDPGALQWISGFTAGMAYARAGGAVAANEALPGPVAAPAVRPEAAARLAIIYGSQTGNGKRIAERLGRAAEEAGHAARVYSTRDCPLKDLAKERLLTVVVSTHGDGDPPDDARGFLEHLLGKRAPRLEQLTYAVLALGDSSYPKFCKTGRQVDERLAALGARRLVDRVDCDVDYERSVAPWLEQVVGGAREALGGSQGATVTRLRTVPAAPLHSREQPSVAAVLANDCITGRGASKDVRHIELSLEGSGLRYEPGDALGVWHENPPEVVDGVLSVLGAPADQPVTIEGRTLPLGVWLARERELMRLTRPFLVQHAERSGDTELARILAPGGSTGLAGHSTARVASSVEAAPAAEAQRSGSSSKASRTREEVELVFDRNKSAIYALYSRAPRDNPALQGKVVLEVTIAPSGEVTAARIVSSELGDAELERKLVARVKMFRFEAKDVAPMTTTKPIEFFPA